MATDGLIIDLVAVADRDGLALLVSDGKKKPPVPNAATSFRNPLAPPSAPTFSAQ